MIKCLKCGEIIKSNTIPSKCPNCNNTDLMQFIRVDDDYKNPILYKRDLEWLEARRLKEN